MYIYIYIYIYMYSIYVYLIYKEGTSILKVRLSGNF